MTPQAEPTQTPLEDSPADTLQSLDGALVAQVAEALDAADPAARAGPLLEELHAADIADLLEQLSSSDRSRLAVCLGDRLDAEVWAHLDEGARAAVVESLSPETMARIVRDLESDDAVDLIGGLSAEEREALLRALPAGRRNVCEQGLAWPENSAGRLMRREMVTVPDFWTVGDVINHMRRTRRDVPEDFYNLIIVDPAHRPVGLVKLSRLLRTARAQPVRTIMAADPHIIPAPMDREDAAFLFRQYGLVEAPVVDESGRLAGVITVDDIVHVLDAVHGEDILNLGGVRTDDFYADVADTTRRRFLWLLINLLTALAASMVIGLFAQSLEQIVALAILMPVVASMGGNAGTQTLTVTVRALATNALTPANALRIVGKETLVGGFNGLLFAALAGVAAAFWFSSPALGAIIAMAMVLTLLAAGLAGILIPLGLSRAGQDPAVASTVLLTTVTDVIGFLAFLGLATWMLL